VFASQVEMRVVTDERNVGERRHAQRGHDDAALSRRRPAAAVAAAAATAPPR